MSRLPHSQLSMQWPKDWNSIYNKNTLVCSWRDGSVVDRAQRQAIHNCLLVQFQGNCIPPRATAFMYACACVHSQSHPHKHALKNWERKIALKTAALLIIWAVRKMDACLFRVCILGRGRENNQQSTALNAYFHWKIPTFHFLSLPVLSLVHGNYSFYS